MQMTPSGEGLLRVLVVIQNRILREGVCCLVENEEDLELAGAVSTADDAVLEFVQLRPGLTLLDLDLPSDGGFAAIERIRQIDPEAWIVALITDEADERSRRAVALGASTVIAKHLIGKVPWHKPPGGRTPLKTGGPNTKYIGVLNDLFPN